MAEDHASPHEVVAAAATKVLQAHFGLSGLLHGSHRELGPLAEPYLAELEDALADLRGFLAGQDDEAPSPARR